MNAAVVRSCRDTCGANALDACGVWIAARVTRMPAKILVVDEDVATLASLSSAIERGGYDVVAARSFRDAVRALDSAAPSLLISALRLGQYNGLHLLVRARAAHSDLAAIVIGPAGEIVAREARSLGAAAYVTYPLDIDALLACVTELLDAAADRECPTHAAAPHAPAVSV
jgi:DNA-binding NtrC family response regulator